MVARNLLLGLALCAVPSSVATAYCDDVQCIPYELQTATLSWVGTSVDGEPTSDQAPNASLQMHVDGTVTFLFDRRGGYDLVPVDAP